MIDTDVNKWRHRMYPKRKRRARRLARKKEEEDITSFSAGPNAEKLVM